MLIYLGGLSSIEINNKTYRTYKIYMDYDTVSRLLFSSMYNKLSYIKNNYSSVKLKADELPQQLWNHPSSARHCNTNKSNAITVN